MLTLTNLQQLLGDALMKLEPARGKDPSLTDLTSLINWAYRIIARKCVLTVDTPLTLVAGQALYNLRDVTTPVVGNKIIRPVLVYINGGSGTRPLYDASERDFGLWSYDELARLYPSWKSDTGGPPTKAAWYAYNQLLLHRPPDSATVALTGHAVFGQYMPNDLSAGTDTPALPEEIHEAIAWLAAQLATTPTASDDLAWARLEKYSEFWTQIIQDVADQNERVLQAWGTTKGYYEDDLMMM